VLGILSISPMSGYELAQAVERSIANFWPVSRSQVYTELARLEELELVGGTDVEQNHAPDKRVFELTPSGNEAFVSWLSIPGYEPDRMRLGFCLKTFFGHHMPREVMVQNLRSFKKENEEHAAYLSRMVELLSTLPEAAFTRATALLGQRIARTAAEWADELLEDLPEIRELPEHEHEEIHKVARELFRKASPP
jgi:PadR family transcriptional regulator, regulatory protein AphA